MENRFLRLIGIVLCVPMLGFMGAAFLRILTVTAVAPVIIALLSAQPTSIEKVVSAYS